MGRKFESKNWFICTNCKYHGDEESLRSGLYVTDISKDIVAVDCPKCGLQQIK